MHMKSFILPSVAALAGLCYAGQVTRGEEILWFYRIYRMDVEVESYDTGSDRNPPWRLASGCVPQEGDFFLGAFPANEPGKDKPPHDRRGCNFHGFMRWISKGSYDIRDAFANERIANQWNPTLQEVRGITEWNKPNAYSRMDLARLLGGSGLPGEEIKDGDSFKNFHLVNQIAAQRIKDLHDALPDVAKKHFPDIMAAGQIVREGRLVDAEGYKIDRMRKDLTAEGNVGNAVKGATDRVQSERFGSFEVLNFVKLDAELKRIGVAKAAKEKVAAVVKDIKANWDKGETKTGTPSDKMHINLIQQYVRIDAAMKKQLGGAEADRCDYPELVLKQT